MISPNSRYANNVVQAVPHGDSSRLTIIEAGPQVRAFNFTYYQISVDDRIDDLAYTYYGNGSLWWRIADANPEIVDWFDIPPGTILRIPSA